MATGGPSPYAYLRHVGAFPVWSRLVVLGALGYGLVEWFLSRQVGSGLYVLLILAPICVGTGVLSAARQGKVDLLVGSGVPRSVVWRTTMLGALLLPAGGALLLTILNASGRQASVPLALVETAGVALFTLGLSAATGLLEPRYLLGVVWLAARIGFLTTRGGAETLHLLRSAEVDGQVPLPSKALASLVFPEVLLTAPRAEGAIAVLALLGALALFFSGRLFVSVELTGRRAE